MNTRLQAYSRAHTQKNALYAALLFLVWPFIAVISAMGNYRQTWAKNIFWAFCAYYGYTFAIGSESQGSDIVRYVAEYQMLHGASMGIEEIFAYFRESGEIDILRTAIAYILSRITDSAAILTLVYGIIFGFFFSRNIWFILERIEGKIGAITIILLACFFLVNPIWHINGFRMWTAAHIFVYGLLPYLFDGRKNKLWISASSILVHFSFVVPLGILIAYLFLGNRVTVFFVFYVITNFISEINLEAFNNIVETYAPEILQERTSGYRSESAIEHRQAARAEVNRQWYAVWYGRVFSYSMIIFITILYFKSRDFFMEISGWANMYSFTLLFYGVANILSLLPSGGRYMTIGHLCALTLIILLIQNRPDKTDISKVVWITLPALLLYIVVSVRIGLYSMSAAFIMGNPVLATIMMGETISLNDVMKMIL